MTDEVYREHERQRSIERRQKKENSEFCLPNGQANDIFLDNASDYKDEQEQERHNELLAEVYDVINNQLSADERNIIMDSFFSGKTQKELAKELGIPESTYSYRKNAILKKIRSILNKK